MAINYGDNAFQRYSEITSSPTISSGSLSLNLSISSVFLVSLTSNISTITISNVNIVSGTSQGFSLILTGDGTQRTIIWPASIKWPGGSYPTPTSTNGKRDVYNFITIDGGTTWLGFIAGQNF